MSAARLATRDREGAFAPPAKSGKPHSDVNSMTASSSSIGSKDSRGKDARSRSRKRDADGIKRGRGGKATRGGNRTGSAALQGAMVDSLQKSQGAIDAAKQMVADVKAEKPDKPKRTNADLLEEEEFPAIWRETIFDSQQSLASVSAKYKRDIYPGHGEMRPPPSRSSSNSAPPPPSGGTITSPPPMGAQDISCLSGCAGGTFILHWTEGGWEFVTLPCDYCIPQVMEWVMSEVSHPFRFYSRKARPFLKTGCQPVLYSLPSDWLPAVKVVMKVLASTLLALFFDAAVFNAYFDLMLVVKVLMICFSGILYFVVPLVNDTQTFARRWIHIWGVACVFSLTLLLLMATDIPWAVVESLFTFFTNVVMEFDFIISQLPDSVNKVWPYCKHIVDVVLAHLLCIYTLMTFYTGMGFSWYIESAQGYETRWAGRFVPNSFVERCKQSAVDLPLSQNDYERVVADTPSQQRIMPIIHSHRAIYGAGDHMGLFLRHAVVRISSEATDLHKQRIINMMQTDNHFGPKQALFLRACFPVTM